MKIDFEKYNCIIGYGIGQYYDKIKNDIKSKVKLDYLYDKRWENSKGIIYDGLPVLSKEELLFLENPLIIIMSGMDCKINNMRFG